MAESSSEDMNYTGNFCTNATNFGNRTVWEFLNICMGSQQMPLDVAIPLTCVNVLIFVTGLLGNMAVCLVIVKHSNMHTATNYYLFNLAVSDLTLLIFGLPSEIAVYWHQYPWILGGAFCKIRALLSEMASYVSVLTIVAFSTERYLSICYPLLLYTMSGLHRAVRIIFCLWLLSFLAALPFSIYTQIIYIPRPDTGEDIQESAFCAMLDPPLPLSELSFLIFFVIPMLIIAVQYTMMGFKISNRSEKFGHRVTGSIHIDSRRSQSNKPIIRMLAAVVIGFFLCWAPFHAQRLLYIYAAHTKYYTKVNEYMFYVTGIFYYFSSTLNPILYNVMSNRYRQAFKEVLFGTTKDNSLGALTRTSTIRETTRLTPNSNSERRYPPIIDEDETMVLMHGKDLLVTTQKGKSTLIYQVNYCDVRPNSETCI